MNASGLSSFSSVNTKSGLLNVTRTRPIAYTLASWHSLESFTKRLVTWATISCLVIRLLLYLVPLLVLLILYHRSIEVINRPNMALLLVRPVPWALTKRTRFLGPQC